VFRNKSGLWGWRSDKTEVVNGRDCKVFSASNVELVTKTRTEHLSPEDKSKVAGSGFLLNSLLAVGQHLEESTTLPVYTLLHWKKFRIKIDIYFVFNVTFSDV
jgi:septin 4